MDVYNTKSTHVNEYMDGFICVNTNIHLYAFECMCMFHTNRSVANRNWSLARKYAEIRERIDWHANASSTRRHERLYVPSIARGISPHR